MCISHQLYSIGTINILMILTKSHGGENVLFFLEFAIALSHSHTVPHKHKHNHNGPLLTGPLTSTSSIHKGCKVKGILHIN